MTGDGPRLSIETPRGAPAHGAALEWVKASATPTDGFLGAEVRIDGAAVGSAVRRLPDQVAVSTWCDTRGIPPGLHEITVDARWEGGARAAETCLMLVTLGQHAELSESPSGEVAGCEVVPLGSPELEERLARTALGGAPVVLLADGCTLAPGALARIAAAFEEPPGSDVVIGDEASMISGTRWIRWRKRAFQPEALPSIDGVEPLMAVGPRAADVLCDALPAEAGIYGLALELVDRGLRTTALPQVLTLTPETRLPTDDPEARIAVQRLADRRGRPARIEAGPVAGVREVRWPLRDAPGIVAVVPSRTPELAARCLAGLAELTDYPGDLRVIVVDSSGAGAEMDDAVAETSATRLPYPAGERFNYQHAVNLGARAAGGAHVLFLNDDVVPQRPDWLTRMTELLTLPGVGIVGAFLRHPDGTIQHAGVQIGEGFGHRYHDAPGDARGHRFELLVPGNPEAVTGACMLVRREVLDEVDGHDETFVQVYGDVDFCFRATERGWRVAWCAGAELEHAESKSFGSTVNPADIELFRTRWNRDRDMSPSGRVRS